MHEATVCVQNIWPGDETIQIIVYGSNILCIKLVNRNHSCLHSDMGNAMSFLLKTCVCIHSVVWRFMSVQTSRIVNLAYVVKCGFRIGETQITTWGFVLTSNLQPVVCLRSLDGNKQNHAGLVQNGELIWWLLTSCMVIKWNHTPTCRVADLIWPCWLHLTSKDISV